MHLSYERIMRLWLLLEIIIICEWELFTYLCVYYLPFERFIALNPPRGVYSVFYIGMSRIFLIPFVSLILLPCTLSLFLFFSLYPASNAQVCSVSFSYESVQMLFVLQNLIGKEYLKYFKNRSTIYTVQAKQNSTD